MFDKKKRGDASPEAPPDIAQDVQCEVPRNNVALLVAVVSLSIGLLLWLPHLEEFSEPDQMGILGIVLGIYMVLALLLIRAKNRSGAMPCGRVPKQAAPDTSRTHPPASDE